MTLTMREIRGAEDLKTLQECKRLWQEVKHIHADPDRKRAVEEAACSQGLLVPTGFKRN